MKRPGITSGKKLEDLLAEYDRSEVAQEEKEWGAVRPIGAEFGSDEQITLEERGKDKIEDIKSPSSGESEQK